MPSSSFQRPKPQVVIIEDEEDVRELLRLLFELDGRFDVVGAAADGSEGIDLVARTQPQAVTLDLHLPDMSGTEVLRTIQEISPASRVVVFSAFPDPLTLLEVLRCGAAGYLDKATAWNELVPNVAELCSMDDQIPADAE